MPSQDYHDKPHKASPPRSRWRRVLKWVGIVNVVGITLAAIFGDRPPRGPTTSTPAPTAATAAAPVAAPAAADDDNLHWRYIGPADKSDLAKEAIEVLIDECRLFYLLKRKDYTTMSAVWHAARPGEPLYVAGWRNTIQFTATFAPDFKGVYWDRTLLGGDIATMTLVGGAKPGIIISGKPAHYICKRTPPIGPNPISFIDQGRLRGLGP